MPVNRKKGDFCEYHVQAAYKKLIDGSAEKEQAMVALAQHMDVLKGKQQQAATKINACVHGEARGPQN